jgi:hypothetical protein
MNKVLKEIQVLMKVFQHKEVIKDHLQDHRCVLNIEMIIMNVIQTQQVSILNHI